MRKSMPREGPICRQCNDTNLVDAMATGVTTRLVARLINAYWQYCQYGDTHIDSWETSGIIVCPYPAAARAESLIELNGTQAWTVVPRLGCDSTDNLPFTSLSRSSMLIRPRPCLSFVA